MLKFASERRLEVIDVTKALPTEECLKDVLKELGKVRGDGIIIYDIEELPFEDRMLLMDYMHQRKNFVANMQERRWIEVASIQHLCYNSYIKRGFIMEEKEQLESKTGEIKETEKVEVESTPKTEEAVTKPNTKKNKKLIYGIVTAIAVIAICIGAYVYSEKQRKQELLDSIQITFVFRATF